MTKEAALRLVAGVALVAMVSMAARSGAEQAADRDAFPFGDAFPSHAKIIDKSQTIDLDDPAYKDHPLRRLILESRP